MHPTPQPARTATQVESRAGVDGVTVWDTGSRGQPYEVQTEVDVETWTIAEALCQAYSQAIDLGPLPIMHGGVVIGDVQVLDVPHATAEAIAAGLGGICGRSEAIVRASWRLIAV
jgi:hypothetical protein